MHAAYPEFADFMRRHPRATTPVLMAYFASRRLPAPPDLVAEWIAQWQCVMRAPPTGPAIANLADDMAAKYLAAYNKWLDDTARQVDPRDIGDLELVTNPALPACAEIHLRGKVLSKWDGRQWRLPANREQVLQFECDEWRRLSRDFFTQDLLNPSGEVRQSAYDALRAFAQSHPSK